MNEQIIEQIYSVAMEKYANEEQAQAFVEGFMKEAAFGLSALNGFGGAVGSVTSNPEFQKSLAKAAVGLGAGLAGAAIVKGLSTAGSGADYLILKRKYDNSLAHALSISRTVKGGKPDRVKSFGDTIFKFAPHVASDPHLLTTILEAAVLSDGLDPTTIKNLVDLENKYRDNTEAKSLIGIRV